MSLRDQGLGDDLEIIIQDADVEPDAGQSPQACQAYLWNSVSISGDQSTGVPGTFVEIFTFA